MRCLRSRVRLTLLLAVAWAVPSLAGAVPITYTASGAFVVISADAGSSNLLTTGPIPLDASSFFTFDDSVPEMTDLMLTITGAGPFTLSTPYGGYDTVTIDTATLEPLAGYDGTNVTLQLAGPPIDNYFYSIGPLNAHGLFSASNSAGPPPPPIVTNAFQFDANSLAGTLFVNTAQANFSLFGITLGVIPPPPNTNLPPLVIKGDFFFRGAVPEPSAVILLGAGLLGLLAMGRRVG